MTIPTAERIRIARELHDGIAQDLVGIGYSLDLLLADDSLSLQARTDIRSTRFTVDMLITKVRKEILDLRRGTGRPFHALLRELAEDMCSGFELTLNLEEIQVIAPTDVEYEVIATEILRNCVQHSRASHIGINLYSVDNRICLEVIDNGIGGANVKDGHFGLTGLTERVQNLGGSITIDSNKGTRIAILM
jgi:signal transduction histidine kinase